MCVGGLYGLGIEVVWHKLSDGAFSWCQSMLFLLCFVGAKTNLDRLVDSIIDRHTTVT
jgi:hypothetical protein